VLADLGRAAQLVAVAAGGGLDEGGVQDGEALQVPARGVAFDAAGVFAGSRVQLSRQVLGEQRSEQHRRQHDVDGNAVAHGEQADDQADEGDGGGGEPQGSGDGGGQGQALGGAPGQPAQGQALRTRRGRAENADLVRVLGRGAVAGDGPGEPAPLGAFVHQHGLALG
jgi:hypothetical protein